MKYEKVSAIVICAVFLLVLSLPVIFMDWKGGSYSENEQRMLADFPVSVDKETGELKTDRGKITSYVSDNIGFRDAFVKIGANIKYNVFRESTSDKVLLGRDGWLYYTPDNNIEIATGDYPLSDEDLALIARIQQGISDYYKSMGVDYILMLTPSKVSIYPEYLPMSDETVDRTPVDIVAEYLRENTDVTVYNAKDTLLKAKADGLGQLYHKTDTHWNQLGSYWVYRGLHDLMTEKGILSDEPLDVNFTDGTFEGEFSKMLGDPDLLDPEPAPIANWEPGFKEITDGELYDNICKTQDKYDKNHDAALFENGSVPEKTLQIYGDSQLMTIRKIPQYLAEHFSTVVNYRIRTVSTVADKTADPDVVLFSVSERYINSLLTQTPDIPCEVTDVSLPEEILPHQNKGYYGMWLDKVNGTKPETKGIIERALFSGSQTVTLSGWAVDFPAGKPLSALYLRIGDRMIKCAYGISMTGPVTIFNNPDFLNSGYLVSFPAEYLDNADDIEFIQIGSGGGYQYAPVTYQLTD